MKVYKLDLMQIFYDFSLHSTAERWKSNRKLLTPAFHFKILENFLPTIIKQTNIMLDLIEKQLKQNNGIIEDIRPLITNCTLDVICGKLIKRLTSSYSFKSYFF
jgi:cytochrome P450